MLAISLTGTEWQDTFLFQFTVYVKTQRIVSVVLKDLRESNWWLLKLAEGKTYNKSAIFNTERSGEGSDGTKKR